jgi:hypothetical protein
MSPIELSNIEKSLHFLSVAGYSPINTGKTIWYNIRPFVYQIFPEFIPHPIDRTEVSKLFRKGKALVCRWFSQSEMDVHTTVVFTADKPYDINRLSSKARNQVRRGFERVIVKREAPSDFSSAYAIYCENLDRLKLLTDPEKRRKRWQRHIATITQGATTEFWAAHSQETGEMLAFLVTNWTPYGLQIILQRSSATGYTAYANNALAFKVITDAFERGAQLVSYGLQQYGISTSGLDHFKLGMGFAPVPLQEHYAWHPLLRPFFSRLSTRQITLMVNKLQSFFPNRH